MSSFESAPPPNASPARPRGRWFALPLLSTVIALFGVASLGDLNQDGFLCQEAIAHAESCCGRLSVAEYFCGSDGCGGADPGLSSEQSRCVIATDCSAMGPICARLNGTTLPDGGRAPSTPSADAGTSDAADGGATSAPWPYASPSYTVCP
jgi:hypothetical protein